ncbi:MAG: hypothetical protein WCT99_04115 [Bacteroidota bacterium]|jgi:hypothetical protein
MKAQHLTILVTVLLSSVAHQTFAQERNYDAPPMSIDVGNFSLNMNKLNGEGGLQSQYSWMLAPNTEGTTQLFYWPADRYQSNMLYQIFHPLVLSDSGILDPTGVRRPMYVNAGNDALINSGTTDWASETRRYRPPVITVDGIEVNPPYKWNVDPNLKSDIKVEFEDVLGQFGIRSHVEIYAFSNPEHADYLIWKATHKFTGELRIPRQARPHLDTIPDQTIQFWWPFSFSFGPSKNGEFSVNSSRAYEGVDDLDSWFKIKSNLATGNAKDSLYIAYYYDSKGASTTAYTTNGSKDDTGDPDRTTGFLHSTQIPGYTLLHADKAYNDPADDPVQPYAIPHGDIQSDLWGRRDIGLKLTYRGDDARGRFPLDPITAGLSATPSYGPMRFITVGPYSLTKNSAQHRYDQITFVYAVGVGSIGWDEAASVGAQWLNGTISDSAKNAAVMKGRDSLGVVMDKANWAWNRLSQGLSVPAAPAPPDISVSSGPDRVEVNWSYPSSSYFNDAGTGVNDWYAWRVYRKRGAFLVNHPNDLKNGDHWELVYETTDRNRTSFFDLDVQRGVDYYYAVTAVDDGTQNDGIDPGKKLESSRYVTRSLLPVTSFKSSLDEAYKARAVPNPWTSTAGTSTGTTGFSGTPNRILFVNLPTKCTLRIFTETGDLVKTIAHYGDGDEPWNLRTEGNQIITSGIYVCAVTDSEAKDGKSIDNQFVKFVVVR